MANQGHIEDEVLMGYAMPSIDGATTSICRPIFQVAYFEIKSTMIQMIKNTIQFNGLSHENPNWHIVNFFKYL